MLSIALDVTKKTFQCLGSDPTEKLLARPSAHNAIVVYCEKLGRKLNTDRFFVVRSSEEKIADKTSDLPYDFLLKCHLAHTARFVIGAIVCDNGRRCPIVGLLHSDFLSDWGQRTRTDFCRKQLRKKSDQFFIGPKVSAHGPIFSPNFCLRQKSVRVRWVLRRRTFNYFLQYNMKD